MKKQNSSEKEPFAKGIRSLLILEIIGKPAEHLIKALEEITSKIDEEKGVRIISKKINEPVLMKDSKEFYTTFAEIELEVEDILYLTVLMFKYMPSHVEVLEPELIALTNTGWTDILSELTRRLHGYDEIARVLQLQNIQMKKKLEEILPKPDLKQAFQKGLEKENPEKEESIAVKEESKKKEPKKAVKKKK